MDIWVYAYEVGRLALAVTLLVAGASKLFSPRPLARSLTQTYRQVRPGAAIVTARAVAVTELAAAFLVASFWAPAVGLGLAGLTGLGIVVFTTTAMIRGTTAPCGCFGESSGRPVGLRNLLAGAGLLIGAALLAAPLVEPLPVAQPEAPARAAVFLPLTAAVSLAAVMLRDRSRLLSPFLRHFRPSRLASG